MADVKLNKLQRMPEKMSQLWSNKTHGRKISTDYSKLLSIARVYSRYSSIPGIQKNIKLDCMEWRGEEVKKGEI